jgi:hypothetical protein
MKACVNDRCNWEGEDAGKQCFRARFCNARGRMHHVFAAAVVMAGLQGPMHGSGLTANQRCALYFWLLVAMATRHE